VVLEVERAAEDQEGRRAINRRGINLLHRKPLEEEEEDNY